MAGRRAPSGIVALALVTLSVGIGLAMAGRVCRGAPGCRSALTGAPRARAPSRASSPSPCTASRCSVDPWLHPGPAGILVPFTMGYRPVFTGLGILAAYLAALLGPVVLRAPAHRRAAVAQGCTARRCSSTCWASCTRSARARDASTPWLRAFLLVTGVPIVVLFVLRSRACGGPAPRRVRAAQGRAR